MKFKFLILIIITMLGMISIYGQQAVSKTEKTDYKIEEIITIDFEIDAVIDSMSRLKIKGFNIFNGPFVNASTTKVGRLESKSVHRISYQIKAKKIGKLKIESPVFYIDNKEFKGKDILLNINRGELTETESSQTQFNEFHDIVNKPEGTIRYVIDEEMGYIEVFKDLKWQFVRKLTKKETKKLIKMKR